MRTLVRRFQRWLERRRGEFRYGDDRTIHSGGEVNVERDHQTGEVVAVWYRCSVLPFTDEISGYPHRAEEMRRMYKANAPRRIRAIVFEDRDAKGETA